jgi:hypothetical protein
MASRGGQPVQALEQFTDKAGGGAKLSDWLSLYPNTDFLPSPSAIRSMTVFYVGVTVHRWRELRLI